MGETFREKKRACWTEHFIHREIRNSAHLTSNEFKIEKLQTSSYDIRNYLDTLDI